jgi:AcrR family transcriptional regulator
MNGLPKNGAGVDDRTAADRAEGIRERKKRLTREMLSNTATRMFLAEGFDVVKVTDIARACDVAEKTVYNYFPTKESLLLDRETAMAESITRALGQAAIKSPIDAALDLLAAELNSILASVAADRDAVGTLSRFADLLESTQSLRAAQRDMDTRLVAVAAQAMAARAELSVDEPEVQIAAQAILGLWRIQFAALRRYVADGATPLDGLSDKITADVRRAARLIDSGLWTFSSAVATPCDRQRLEAAGAAAQRSARRVFNALRHAQVGFRNARASAS